ADHGSDQPSNQCAPTRSSRATVSPGEPKAEPRFDDLTDESQGDNEDDEPDAHRPKIREISVAVRPEEDDPEPGKPERDEQQAGDTAADEKKNRDGVAHLSAQN